MRCFGDVAHFLESVLQSKIRSQIPLTLIKEPEKVRKTKDDLKTESIHLRLSPRMTRQLDALAHADFDGNRSETISHLIAIGTTHLDVPKPPRQRNGLMPRP
jgi:hypothetical protein